MIKTVHQRYSDKKKYSLLYRNLIKYAMEVEKSRKYKNKSIKIMRVREKLQ